MSDTVAETEQQRPVVKTGDTLPKDDVAREGAARAPLKTDHRPKPSEAEVPPKKRKTRRGKSKRRQPYAKNRKLIKPEAPHNSNQFLFEDHGEELDDFKSIDRVSASTVTRTRDSSFSVDSDGEFYSSPDDEEQFLIKDFDDQYESVHAERLQAMSKSQLIEECIMLEDKLEQLSRRLQKREERDGDDSEDSRPELKREVERLTIENERLRRGERPASRDSCSSSSSSCSSSSCASRSRSPVTTVDYSQTNGHPSPTSLDPV
ncbi:hypothetical protein NQ318_013258 [Aromia moschata]|uniref:Uncharacterized protein n=1 Tax=Aromia moschata TaxID=1265417 RepID=A0AAV8XS57_9CUCU|nr:hypothetical protein NQ318_013258 [Aromia moschata]